MRDGGFRQRCEGAANDAKLAVVTRSGRAASSSIKDGMIKVPAAPIEKLVDATGAGDLFAAGFLFGLAREPGCAKPRRGLAGWRRPR